MLTRPDMTNHWARSFIPMKSTFPHPAKSHIKGKLSSKFRAKLQAPTPYLKDSATQPHTDQGHPLEFTPPTNTPPAPQNNTSPLRAALPEKNWPNPTQAQTAQSPNNLNMSIDPSLRAYLRKTYIALAILVIGIGGWASLSSIKSAVIAQGTISVAGKPESVQHLDGGRISAIHVQDGQFVNQGDVILELDRVILDANLSSAQTSYFENQALIARLSTEKNGQALIEWPRDLLANQANPAIRQAMNGQQSLLIAKQTALNGQIQQISQQIEQFDNSITNFDHRIAILNDELSIVEQDLPRLQNLLSQRLIPKDRVTILERDQARLTRERATIIAEKENVSNTTINARLEIEQIIKSQHEAVLTELRAAQTQTPPLQEQVKTLSQKQSHIDVIATASGIVHNLNLTTLGGVIAPGQEIVQIIPQDNRLLVNIKIRPQDIDQVNVGQKTRILFSSLNQKITPELDGEIIYISANSIQDEITGEYFFKAHVQFSQTEKKKLGGVTLLPGMQAETYIQTGSRSVLSYVTKPVKDAMSKAMRET